MIKTKQDLLYYLEEDRKSYHKPAKKSIKERIVEIIFKDRFYEYMRCLRKLEYYQNTRGGILGFGMH